MADATVLKGITDSLTAIGALGLAAMGLVDTTKPFWGGVSNFGSQHIANCLKPFEAALDRASQFWRQTLRSHWLNGTPLDQQKAVAKSLVRLGLNPDNARGLAPAGNVDPDKFAAAVASVFTGQPLTSDQVTLLSRFDAAVDTALDAGYERADQKYRNAARATAGAIAIVLAVVGGYLLVPVPDRAAYWWSPVFWQSVLIGIVSVPIAPIAKDLASSLATAVGALKSVRGG
jgi:hypothetical protein